MGKYCVKCGNQLNDEDVFCPNCGTESLKRDNVKQTENIEKKVTEENVIKKIGYSYNNGNDYNVQLEYNDQNLLKSNDQENFQINTNSHYSQLNNNNQNNFQMNSILNNQQINYIDNQNNLNMQNYNNTQNVKKGFEEFSILAFICTIISILSIETIWQLIIGILAIVFGVISLFRKKSYPNKRGEGFAFAAIMIGIIDIIIYCEIASASGIRYY